MNPSTTYSFMHPTEALSASTGTKLEDAPFRFAFMQNGRSKAGKVVCELQLSRADGNLLAFAERAEGQGRTDIEAGAQVLVSGVVCKHRSIQYLYVTSIRGVQDIDREWKLNLICRDMIADLAAYRALREIIWQLDAPMRSVVCEVLSHDDIASGFFQAPSSVSGHHSVAGGNLRHAVEVAQLVMGLAENYGAEVDRDLAIAAAILHDVGKALEYEAGGPNAWRMSLRGKLIGHKLSGYEYVASAVRACEISQDRAVALLHCLSATKAPDYLGLRAPACLEAHIVSTADRLSGQAELFSRMRVPDSFLGKRHPHLSERPFYPAHLLTLSEQPNGGKP